MRLSPPGLLLRKTWRKVDSNFLPSKHSIQLNSEIHIFKSKRIFFHSLFEKHPNMKTEFFPKVVSEDDPAIGIHGTRVILNMLRFKNCNQHLNHQFR